MENDIYWYEPRSMEVIPDDDRRPTFTGIYTVSGYRIMRNPEPIGFAIPHRERERG